MQKRSCWELKEHACMGKGVELDLFHVPSRLLVVAGLVAADGTHFVIEVAFFVGFVCGILRGVFHDVFCKNSLVTNYRTLRAQGE